MLPRAQITTQGKDNGMDTVKVMVRSGSKMGAVATARVEAAQSIPLRSQEVVSASTSSNARFFSSWEVEVADLKPEEDILK